VLLHSTAAAAAAVGTAAAAAAVGTAAAAAAAAEECEGLFQGHEFYPGGLVPTAVPYQQLVGVF
jgi:hypothetical protein